MNQIIVDCVSPLSEPPLSASVSVRQFKLTAQARALTRLD